MPQQIRMPRSCVNCWSKWHRITAISWPSTGLAVSLRDLRWSNQPTICRPQTTRIPRGVNTERQNLSSLFSAYSAGSG
jgi:hypothetical protein